MKLLTVDEVRKLWRCHRVTILRLMRRGTLPWVEVDGEPVFDEAEVLRLKNPRIGIFPHLTISRGGSRQPPRERLALDQLVWRYQRIDETFEKLTQEARWLAVEAKLCAARSRQARGEWGRAREASWAGLDAEPNDYWSRNNPVQDSIRAGGEILPPRR
jgi:hypothetical protein